MALLSPFTIALFWNIQKNIVFSKVFAENVYFTFSGICISIEVLTIQFNIQLRNKYISEKSSN